jgi:hypothetical protein
MQTVIKSNFDEMVDAFIFNGTIPESDKNKSALFDFLRSKIMENQELIQSFGSCDNPSGIFIGKIKFDAKSKSVKTSEDGVIAVNVYNPFLSNVDSIELAKG